MMNVNERITAVLESGGLSRESGPFSSVVIVCCAVWCDDGFTPGLAWSIQPGSDAAGRWCDDIEDAHPSAVCCKWQVAPGMSSESLGTMRPSRCRAKNASAAEFAAKRDVWYHAGFAVGALMETGRGHCGDWTGPAGMSRVNTAALSTALTAGILHSCAPLPWMPTASESLDPIPPEAGPVYHIPSPVVEALDVAGQRSPFKAVLPRIGWTDELSKRSDRGQGVKVAVIDTGIDRGHPAFAASGHISYADATGAFPDPSDSNGHGTWCCGAIWGRSDDSDSPHFDGIAPGCEKLAVRGLTPRGEGTDAMLARGVDIAVAWGAKVISCSWGGGFSPVISAAIKRATAAGAVVVAAAGNDGPGADTVGFPGALEDCICVAASTLTDPERVADFSSRGAAVDVTAPGQAVYGPYRNRTYAAISGTSMSTPEVAAAVALLSESAGLNTPPASLMSALAGTARPLPNAPSTAQGFGVINIGKAIGRLKPTVPPANPPADPPVVPSPQPLTFVFGPDDQWRDVGEEVYLLIDLIKRCETEGTMLTLVGTIG